MMFMVGNQQINFASEADLLKAKLAIQQMTGGGQQAGLPQLMPGAGGGGGVTTFHSKLRVKLSGTDQSYVTVIVLIT
jgi:hypothetical protein